jgi:hypothetical protein
MKGRFIIITLNIYDKSVRCNYIEHYPLFEVCSEHYVSRVKSSVHVIIIIFAYIFSFHWYGNDSPEDKCRPTQVPLLILTRQYQT